MIDLQASGDTVAVAADLHCNSTVGLCPPRVRLDDGGMYEHSRFQGKLWECWCDFWQQANREKTSKLIAVLAGDLVDGDHHNTTQIISRNMETQRQIALATLAPVMEAADELYIVRGTPVHTGQAAQHEEQIGYDLQAKRTPNGNFSWWHLELEVEGVRFDVAHHGKLGHLPWTRSNMANRLAVEVELAYYRAGKRPPHFALRAHRHKFADSGLDLPVRVLFLPAWQGPTDYVHAIAPGAQPDVGGLIFQVANGTAGFRVVGYTETIAWVN